MYNDPMDTKRQFSLSYLFLETFWVALAVGLGRIFPTQDYAAKVIISLVFCVSVGAAACGLLKNMRYGALLGGIVWAFGTLFWFAKGS